MPLERHTWRRQLDAAVGELKRERARKGVAGEEEKRRVAPLDGGLYIGERRGWLAHEGARRHGAEQELELLAQLERPKLQLLRRGRVGEECEELARLAALLLLFDDGLIEQHKGVDKALALEAVLPMDGEHEEQRGEA